MRLDPTYVPAREALAWHILAAIGYDQHELPSGYFRDEPDDDLLSLHEVEALLADPVDANVRASLQDRNLARKLAVARRIAGKAYAGHGSRHRLQHPQNRLPS